MTDIPPGNNPVPDFQGDLEECSRYAIGKGIASGFMKKKTVPGQEIDVAQNEVSAVLCNQDGIKVFFFVFLDAIASILLPMSVRPSVTLCQKVHQ